MYVEELELRDFRAIEKARLALLHPEITPCLSSLPNVNILLGNNGSGKTTLLRALALATVGPVLDQSGFVPYFLIRKKARSGKATLRASVRLHGQDLRGAYSGAKADGPFEMALDVVHKGTRELCRAGAVNRQARAVPSRVLDASFDEYSPALFVVGYAATRRVGQMGKSEDIYRSGRTVARYQRIAGLFDESSSLTPLEDWLPELKQRNPGRHAQAAKLMGELMPAEVRFTGVLDRKRQPAEYIYRVRNVEVPCGALSDGYRAYISWIADLLYHVCMSCPSGGKLVENKGLVLVDEIDLHLHPSWQREVVGTIARKLPNLQFVFTTHSPIVVGSLPSANVSKLSVDPDGSTILERIEQPVHGLASDQILTSDYFGLETTRTQEAATRLDELKDKARLGDEEAAIEVMRIMAHGLEAWPHGSAATRRRAQKTSR